MISKIWISVAVKACFLPSSLGVMLWEQALYYLQEGMRLQLVGMVLKTLIQ